MPQVPQAFKRESLLCNGNVMRVCLGILAIVIWRSKIVIRRHQNFILFCLNLWCVLSIFGRLRAIPASFRSAVVFFISSVVNVHGDFSVRFQKVKNSV